MASEKSVVYLGNFVVRKMRQGWKSFSFRVQNHEKADSICACCGKKVFFLPLKTRSRFTTVTSMGSRDHEVCPHCFSKSRQRLEVLIFEKNPDWFRQGSAVCLHFAKEDCFDRFYKEHPEIEVHNCDKYPSEIGMEQMDILAIPYLESTVDFVVANQILEHVENDYTAMKEVKRVLKNGGKFIVTVPINLVAAETFEDQSITSEAERLEKYGQKDHVRMYGLDFKNRLQTVFEHVDEYKAREMYSKDEMYQYALSPEESVFVCTK